ERRGRWRKRVAAKRVRTSLARVGLPDVPGVRSTGAERHGRRAERLDRADAGADHAERSVRAPPGAALRRSREENRGRRSGQADRSRVSHRADASADRDRVGDRARLGEGALDRRADARAVQPERVRVHPVTAMKTTRYCWSRREFLFRSGGGVSWLALAYLLNQDQLLASDAEVEAACDAKASGVNPFAPKPPHFKPRATAVI